jgi:hypothetical protein
MKPREMPRRLRRGFFTFSFVARPDLRGEWNLRADDLTQQSEETINFLYDLLK